ncbi:MAG TPA: hypothetical protein VFR09_05810 [Alphaproteobacteria bacterium]|nr:hypothetical protein [Alphaproteobacteria bacterium]
MKKHPLEIAAFIISLLALIFTGYQAWRAGDTAHRQLRAYVGLGPQNVALQVPTVLIGTKKCSIYSDCIVIDMKNYGATPAQHVASQATWIGIPKSFVLDKTYKYPTLASGNNDFTSESIIFPGQEYISEIQVKDVSVFKHAFAQENDFYLYGYISYKDIYNQKRTTNFCYRGGFGDNGYYLTPCPDYNNVN